MTNSDFTLSMYKQQEFANIYYEIKDSYKYKAARKYSNREINRQIIHNHLSNLAYSQLSIFEQVNPNFILNMENYFERVLSTNDFSYFVIAYSCFIMDICEEYNIADPWLIFDILAPMFKNLLNALYTITKEGTL